MATMSNAETPRGQGEVFLDARGNGRALRLTWHNEVHLVVLSLWRDGLCAATFRLSKDDVNDFIDAMVTGLRDERPAAVTPPRRRGMRGAPSIPELARRVEVDATEQEAPYFSEWAFGNSLPGQRATAS